MVITNDYNLRKYGVSLRAISGRINILSFQDKILDNSAKCTDKITHGSVYFKHETRRIRVSVHAYTNYLEII